MSQSKMVDSRGKVWLNVGSHFHVLDEFVNIDNHICLLLAPFYPFLKHILTPEQRSLLEAFYDARSRSILLRHDCRKRLPFADGSVEHILCSHFIHHLYPDEAIRILQEYRRILIPAGTLHIIGPSLARFVDEYITAKSNPNAGDIFVQSTEFTHAARPSFRYRLLAFLGYEGLQSRWMYDRDSLLHRLSGCGFRLLPENKSPSASFRLDEPERNINLLFERL